MRSDFFAAMLQEVEAGFNLGDCFSYALASVLGECLLYKGDKFRSADLVAAHTP